MSETNALNVLLKNREGTPLIPYVNPDTELSAESEKPVQTKAVYEAVQALQQSMGEVGKRYLGEIFAYPGATPPEGAYLLNGQTIANCSTLYPDFWAWLMENAGEMIETPVYKSWTMPALTANGTIGGTEYAVEPSSTEVSNYSAYLSFDGTQGGAKTYCGLDDVTEGHLIWYSPVKVKLTSILFQNPSTASSTNRMATFAIYGSNDGSTWDALASGTYADTSANTTQTVEIPESAYSVETPGYQYFKIEAVNGGGSNMDFPEITLYGQEYLYTDYAGNGNILTMSHEAYEYTLARTGICGGFVVDTAAGSVRLPKWHYQPPLGETLPVRGNGIALGMTNGVNDYGITWEADTTSRKLYAWQNAYGKEVASSSSGLSSPPTDGSIMGITQDPDNSGIVAENNAPVDHFVWCIQVYNAATELSTQESAQLASEMQTKAQTDLANVTNPVQAFRSMVATWVLPDYTAGVSIPKGTTYTAETNGLLVCELYKEGTGRATGTVTINNISFDYEGNDYDAQIDHFYLKQGDSCVYTGSLTLRKFIFYPMRGEK